MYSHNPLHEKRKQAFFDRLRKHFPEQDEDDLQELLAACEIIDPTPNGKYVAWLIRELISGRVSLPEDSYLLNQVLQKFHRFKHKLPNADINAYDKGKLAISIGAFELPEETATETRAREKTEGRKVIHQDDLYRLVEITTPLAAREAAKGTAWCVSSLDVATEYIATGKLLLLERRENDIWKSFALAHLGYQTRRGRGEADDYVMPTAQIMDVEDASITRLSNPAANRIIATFRIGFDPFVSQRIRIFGNAYEKRYWEENFTNDEEWSEIWSSDEGHGAWEDDSDRLGRLFLYSEEIIQQRDPEIEQQLLESNNPYSLIAYAEKMIGGPWIEAEPTIAASAAARGNYISNVYTINRDFEQLKQTVSRLEGLDKRCSSTGSALVSLYRRLL